MHPIGGLQTARLVGYDIYLCSIHDWFTLLIRESHRGGLMMDTPTSSAPPGDDSPTIHVPAIEGPVWVAWREGTLTRAKELEALCLWVRPRDTQENDRDTQENDVVLAKAMDRHLDAARQAARVDPLDPPRPFRILRIFRNGPLIERARSNLDAAEAHLLTLAPNSYILGQNALLAQPCAVSSPSD
jgi:hypothetical protein